MFEGQAEEAMTLYCETIPESRVLDVTRYGPDEDGPEGTIKLARASIGGTEIMIFNSPVHHAFTFTPAASLFVDCSSDQEQEHIISVLSKDGAFLMPAGNYGFSRRFAWFNDRFGVSWQINLP
ncbi:VOC family protein [Mesorhizobium sp. M1C.F.Ca.ET.193.01.1.1]|nr:VOC family protein [Mesorhizobium sp. M1C.F.Ca.ET.210.01.1.1]TGQ76183.1 VOC family protein [Mesorhizobium sp. M1C.F.Ca.ET.212.01.1.1]TGR14566.1 VOC family protein [Mesorhizobium sp. M1C.F.Ca.ET.204.01.1.1]TGR35730.1 VOC family protein [Mesorhizobium sp. M1C.F.Ca.ET.196.01.1.1]TGR58002.1 VOC family protein [Mesorhizobium sp. M1C.F.Ca.ET.195.01.1.1]TGR70714.1 VOC family protein [Mesorhizobium sp. M1C.F.Ca.ET.192.01.1.1]TGR86196.1 VOC family protein [Mesorhizobium sp. M1C.F.Ca.ET.189.01.1.1]